jgi:hypothetical protein
MGHRLEVADVFREFEQEFLTTWGHTLSRQQRRAFRDICACRTVALGTHIEQCDTCRRQRIRYNSCRSRHCPKCQSTARDRWLAKQARHLLPTSYCHVVFTLPHELSSIARQNSQLIYNLLFRAARDALLTVAADPKRLGAHLGFLSVLHTWDQKMLHHPHLHCLVPAGGLSLDRSRWVRCRKRFFLPVRVLGARFRKRFLALLAACYRQKKLRLCGPLSALRRPAAFDRLYRALKRKRWVVYSKRPFGGPEQVLKYLARYTHRIAISNGRLVSIEGRNVTFWWRDSRDGNAQKLLTLDAVEFIRRFLIHVLPQGFVKIRHFGFLANGKLRESLALCRSLIGDAGPDLTARMLNDAQIRAVQRKCPFCDNGTLRIIGWLPAGAIIDLPSSVLPNTS